MTPGKLPHAQRLNVQKDESGRGSGQEVNKGERRGKERGKKGREGGRECKRKKKESQRERGRARERYYKSGEKGKPQLLNDHPVHSYLSRG